MEMTKKQRVMAALKGEPVDRPPVSFWRHFAGEDAKGVRCAEQHAAFYRATDLDFIKVMHDGLTAPCPLQVQSIEDLRDYRVQGRENPYIRDYVERAKRVSDALGDEVYVYCNVFAPLTLLRRIGDEKLMAFIRADKPAVLHAMEVLSEELALLCELLIREAGCLGVFAAFQGAETTRFTPEEFAEIVRPYDLRMLQAANEASDYNILHFCAWDEIKNQMQLWQDYPGRVVNWAIYVDGLDLAAGRDYFGGRTVMGGFDNRRGRVLYQGTREEVEAETRKILRDYAAATGSLQGLIVGADCSFLTDFELERFNWVSQALKDISKDVKQ